jgi:hypothetical protein
MLSIVYVLLVVITLVNRRFSPNSLIQRELFLF